VPASVRLSHKKYFFVSLLFNFWVCLPVRPLGIWLKIGRGREREIEGGQREEVESESKRESKGEKEKKREGKEEREREKRGRER
jgi:hypothetical protein